MLILSSISSGLEFWLVKRTSIYENFESKVVKSMKFVGEISNNSPNDLCIQLCVQDSWILLIIVVNNITMYQYYFSNF